MNKKSINFHPKPSSKRKVLTISVLQLNNSERSREFGMAYTNAHFKLANVNFSFDINRGLWLNGKFKYYYYLIIHK